MSDTPVSAPETPVATPDTPAFAEDEVGLLAPLYPLPRLELVEGRGAWVRDAGGRERLRPVQPELDRYRTLLGDLPVGIERV